MDYMDSRTFSCPLKDLDSIYILAFIFYPEFLTITITGEKQDIAVVTIEWYDLSITHLKKIVMDDVRRDYHYARINKSALAQQD